MRGLWVLKSRAVEIPLGSRCCWHSSRFLGPRQQSMAIFSPPHTRRKMCAPHTRRGQKVTVHCTGYGKNRDLSEKFWSTKDPGQVSVPTCVHHASENTYARSSRIHSETVFSLASWPACVCVIPVFHCGTRTSRTCPRTEGSGFMLVFSGRPEIAGRPANNPHLRRKGARVQPVA